MWFRDRRRDINALVHTSDQRKTETMGFPGLRAPKKAKTMPSARKVIGSVFWDARGVIHVEYLEKEKTITGAYYVD